MYEKRGSLNSVELMKYKGAPISSYDQHALNRPKYLTRSRLSLRLPTDFLIAAMLISILSFLYFMHPIVANTPLPNCDVGSGKEHHGVVKNDGRYWPYQTFKSSPAHPPELEITKNGEELAPGLVFLTPNSPFDAAKDVGPMIMTDDGQLVWSGGISTSASNLRVSEFEGRPVISVWNGETATNLNGGHGYGNITLLDESYKELVTVCPKVGTIGPENATYHCEADAHESHITPRGTIIYTVYNATQADLSSVGGPVDGWVFDGVVIEVDPRTGEILFQWSALEHVPVSDSNRGLGLWGNNSFPFDFFHVNSAVEVGDDHYLINARHTFSTYLVHKNGTIVWTFEGSTGGDFSPLPEGGNFSWQHHPRPFSITPTSMTLTLFNNHGSGADNSTEPTNGLKFELSYPPGKKSTARLITSWLNPAETRPLNANSQGSCQVLPNGNTMLGYGQLPIAREYGPGDENNTNVRWQARFGMDSIVQGYRTFKHEWSATPKDTKPALIVEKGQGGCGKGYVSWNGMTNVEAWDIYAGEDEESLTCVGKVPYMGFETEFGVSGGVVQVAALLEGGEEFRSEVVKV